MCSSTPSSSPSSVLTSKYKTNFSKLEACDSNHPHYSEFKDNDSLANVHQVFLSFRGEQLRYNFVSHLIDAFERCGILFFVDKKELRGKNMRNLFVRIEESKIALVIFSSRYAESSWCMDELVKIKKRMDKGKLQVIPIFYKVRARHVREQTDEFGEKFWALAKTSRGVQIKEWKEALESISNMMGLSLGDKRSEADFIKEIVEEVQRVLATIEYEEKENHLRINLFQNKKRKKTYFQNTRRKALKISHIKKTSGAKSRSSDI
ncbi:Disease resistance protein RBA1 [Cardamine amara subsp. amara]|uniref:Disease resistance protein RBA1 n=1 Tax=Cardamine amara subsp. amara TaxID=228776 RepID=A0ABD1A6W6_CARAN